MFQPQNPLDKTRWLPTRNDSGEQIPAFAVMKVTGVTMSEGVAVYTVDQYDGNGTTFMYNGPLVVPISGYGSGSFDSPGLVACNSTPVVGETRGPVSGSWLLQTSGVKKVTVIGTAISSSNIASVTWPPVAAPASQPITGYILSDSKVLTSGTADEHEFDSGSYPSPLSGDLYTDYLRVRSGHAEHLEQLAAGQRYLVHVTVYAQLNNAPLSSGNYCVLRTWLSMNLLNTPDDGGSWTSTGGPLESQISFNPTVTNTDKHVTSFHFLTSASATHFRFMAEAFSSTSINVTTQVAAHWIPVET